jgi:hypothetical protein
MYKGVLYVVKFKWTWISSELLALFILWFTIERHVYIKMVLTSLILFNIWNHTLDCTFLVKSRHAFPIFLYFIIITLSNSTSLTDESKGFIVFTSFLSYCFSALLILLLTPKDKIIFTVVNFDFSIFSFFQLKSNNQVFQTLTCLFINIINMQL